MSDDNINTTLSLAINARILQLRIGKEEAKEKNMGNAL